MARAFAVVLGDRFTFVIASSSNHDLLAGIRYKCVMGRLLPFLKLFRLRSVFLACWLWLHFFKQSESRPSVFVNDVQLARVLVLLKRIFRFCLIVEVHGSCGRSALRALRKADTLIFVTQGLMRQVTAGFASMPCSVVLPNAVDVAAFDSVTQSAHSLREELGLPQDVFLVGYIGRFKPLGISKGVEFMIAALSKLPPFTRLLLVGGTDDEVDAAKLYAHTHGVADRVLVVPHVKSGKIPLYAKACDALAYVPEASSEFFEYETSPMKLYEYMASKRPIIISDMPAFREVLDETAAFVIEPNSEAALVRAIETIRSNPAEAAARMARAYERVKENTWLRRVKRIIDLVS